ncbi:hypothetical protein [Streptomyces sp. NPDC003077]|uniref:hypothetical protein n=1 Tax=Streptomyces sp. NPDC003077 TaxID=3154443 RepID=UPI0033AB7F2E
MTPPPTSVSAGRGRYRKGELIGTALSILLITVLNLFPIYMVFLAFAVTPDGPWDVAEAAARVRMLAAVGGALAVVAGVLTAVVLATRWLRSRWWLATPVVLLACAVGRWLVPN